MLRQPKLDVDGAGAWLLPWAKQQLARLKKLVKFGTRQFNLPTGEEVTVSWGFLDKIRITAGVVAGRFVRTVVGATTVPLRQYYVVRGKLRGFGETHPSDTQVSGTAMLSRDGTTFAYLAAQGGNVGVTIQRKQRDLQRNTVAGASPTSSAFEPVVTNYGASLAGDVSAQLTPVQNGYVSRSGKVILGAVPFPTASRGATPLVYAMTSDDPTDTSTNYALAHSGVPQPVIDFYASTVVPATVDAATFEVTMRVPDSPYQPGYDYTGFGVAGITPHLTLAFDHFGDAPVCVARLPYVTRVENINAPLFGRYNFVTWWGLRFLVMRWSAGQWVVEASYDFPELYFVNFVSRPVAPIYSTEPGLTTGYGAAPGIDSTHSDAPVLVAGAGLPARLAWVVGDYTCTAAAGPDPATGGYFTGTLTHTGVSVYLYLDNVLISTLPGVGGAGHVASITHATRDSIAVTNDAYGFYNVQRSGGTWSATLTSPSYLPTSMSMFGSNSISFSPSGTLFHVGPTEVRSRPVLVDPPGAPEVAAYSTAPADGFWFIGSALWSYDKEGAFKAKVYEYVVAGSGATKNVVGGTIVIPTIGVFNIPISAGPPYTDGLDAGGGIYWSVSGSSFASLTPADFDTAFGVSGTTFNPNPANPYVITAAGSNTWKTSVRKLQYDLDTDVFKTLETYSLAAESFESRGSAVETIPPAPTTTSVSSSDVEMVQDEYLMHQ